MKKIILLFMVITIIGCSSDTNDSKKTIPGKFDIKIEIKGSDGSSPKASILVNSFGVKEWTNINFPFEGAYTYYTKGDEISNTTCKCITISAWAYISSTDKIESYNLYVNEKLVNTTNVASPPDSNGIINPTILEFVYNP